MRAAYLMRIAIDYTSAIAQRAGIGRYTRSLVDALTRLEMPDHLTLYSSEAPTSERPFPPAPGLRTRVAGYGAHAVGNRWMTILWHRARVPLPIELLVGRAEVFHAPDFSLAPTLFARRIVTIHDLAYLTHPECALPSLITYLNRVVPRAIRAADRVIAVSATTARDLTAHLGVSPAKITTIPLGVSAEFQPVRERERLAALDARLGLAHPLVLAVGTIEPRKNYERLIAAFAEATRAPGGPRMLAISGRDGWLSAPIYAAARRAGMANRVRFLGYVPDADLPTLYSTAEVLAMPSLYEGFGIPILEAMACGTPVLCSDGGSLPEVAGEAALVVPATETDALRDGLLRLCGDEHLRATLRERGLARARAFTWEAAAHAHLALYHMVGTQQSDERKEPRRWPH